MKENIFPRYIEFKQFYIRRCKNRSNISSFELYMAYLGAMVFLFWLKVCIIQITSKVQNSDEYKYPSSKYKRIIKKGVLFKTVEYHER